MRKLVISLAAGAVCALALAALSVARPTSTVWTAALSSGQEVPKQVVKNAAAHGLFKGTLSGDSWGIRTHLREADRWCDRRTHPPRGEGRVGERRRSALRAP